MSQHLSLRAITLVAAITSGVAAAAAQQPSSAAPPQAPAGGQQPPVRGGYTEAATLPARIMDFKAEPASIKVGESTTLTWAVENPRSTRIDPAIGRVAPRSLMKVTPAATTTYTLTVTGVNGTITRTVTVNVAGGREAANSAAAAASGGVPRAADGKPDLTGVYGGGAGIGNLGGGRGGAAAPSSGGLPRTPTLKPGAEKFRVVRGPTDTGQYASCMPPGVPQTFFVPYYFQIVQAPRHVVILHEYLGIARIIPTDGTPHPPDPDPFWMGHSIGRWEGDTLVVDSIGFNDKTEIQGYRHTEALHVVERFRRTAETLEYEAVIEDPNVFAGPWQVTRTFSFLPEYNRVDEFVCENNKDYTDLFGAKP
jgi:hypothetical protein